MTSAALVVASLTPTWLGVQAAGGNVGGANANGKSAQGVSTPACRYANVRPTRTNLGTIVTATICLIVRERMRHRLPPLRANGELGTIATRQARDMVLGGYFGDNSASGQTPLQRVVASRYGWRSPSLLLGQNIGWGVGAWATPNAMVRSWMASPPHRRIILTSSYQDVGAGVIPTPPGKAARRQPGATYVLDLAARAAS